MNEHFNKVVLALFGFFFAFLISAAPASAQTTIGLQLKPAVIEGQVNPGEVHEYSVSVTNISKASGTYYILTQDIKGVDDEGRPIFSNQGEVTGYELSSWVTLPQTVLDLGPGETKTISFVVHVPAGASPGSHFASIFLSDKPTAPETSGTGVGFNVGSIISLRISGDIHEEAQLREFSTGKLVYGTANVDFNVKIQNLGNVLVQPTGSIEVTSMFGKKVATIDVNPALASTFPGASRTYLAQWASDSFAFGRYQALATLVYGDEARKTVYSTTSFWVLPLVPIAIVLGSLFAVVLFTYLMMRSYIRRKLRQMGAPAAGYSRKYQRSSSRLMIVTMAVILLCIVFLVALFLMFA